MISGFVVPLCKHKKKKNQNSLRNHTLNTQNDKVETDKMHLFEKQKTDEGIHQNACSQKLYNSVFLNYTVRLYFLLVFLVELLL